MFRLLFGLGLTTLFVYLIAGQLDMSLVWETIRNANFLLVALCVIPLMMSFSIRIFRWWYMLRSHAPNLAVGACVWPYLLGVLLNIVIPLRAGDMARAFGFRSRLQSPATRVLGTLVVERVLDLMVVVLFFFVGLLGATTTNIMPDLFGTIVASVAGVALVVLTVLLFGQTAIRGWILWLVANRASHIAICHTEWSCGSTISLTEFHASAAGRHCCSSYFSR